MGDNSENGGSENPLPETKEDADAGGRRSFLTRSGVVMAVFTAMGIGGARAATGDGKLSRAEGKLVKEVVQEAIRNGGDLDAALKVKKATLPPQVDAILRKMTPEDWAAAGRVNSKLEGLNKVLLNGTNNNGYVGM